MQPARSLDELRKRAAKYMQLEELREFRKDENERLGRSTNRGDRRRDNRGSWFSRYTLLTTERGRILDEALSAELIPLPRKASSPENADQRKQCWYHQNSGHSNEECQALKDKIKELIQVGHLHHFVQGA